MRFLMVFSALWWIAASAIAEDYKAPRGADSVHPDLNGIWQALGSAHYDIEMHTASHSMQVRERASWAITSDQNALLGCGRGRASGYGRCGRQ